MAIVRVHGGSGWGVNEKLTSAQMNAIDINLTHALDKRDGQTDTLFSTVTVGNDGSIEFASGSGLSSDVGSTVSFAGSVGTSGTSTFGGVQIFGGTGNAVTSPFTFTSLSTVTIDTAATLNASRTLTVAGTVSVTTGTLTAGTSSTVNLNNVVNFGAASVTTYAGSSASNWSSGAHATWNVGSLPTFKSNPLLFTTAAGTPPWARAVQPTDNGTGSRVSFDTLRMIERVLGQATFDTGYDSGGVAKAYWNFSGGTGRTWINTNDYTAGSQMIEFEIDVVPQGGYLNTATIYCKAASGHGALPATMPSVFINMIDLASGTVTRLVTQSDPSAIVADFEARHEITAVIPHVSGHGQQVKRDQFRYYVGLVVETGSNALPGMAIYGASCNFETSAMDEF